MHKIHPLAGQGFNMTIRDIKILSNIIDSKLNLGLELDSSVAETFQKKTKHLNYIYASSIDFIYEFFKIDNKVDNFFSESFFKLLNKQNFIKKYATQFADKGIVI